MKFKANDKVDGIFLIKEVSVKPKRTGDSNYLDLRLVDNSSKDQEQQGGKAKYSLAEISVNNRTFKDYNDAFSFIKESLL